MKSAILCFLAIFLSGCAGMGRPEVSINAISAPDANDYRTYVFLPAVESQQGLEFDQYAAQIDQILASKGFIKVDDIRRANFAVGLVTNVGEMKSVTRSGAIPQWGRTGYSSSQTYGSVYGNQYQSNTYYTPTYGVTGYMPYSNTVTYYPIGFVLSAWTGTGDGKDVRQIWSVKATSTSKSGDLRSAFPRMLQAVVPYIAGDTHGIVTVKVPNN